MSQSRLLSLGRAGGYPGAHAALGRRPHSRRKLVGLNTCSWGILPQGPRPGPRTGRSPNRASLSPAASPAAGSPHGEEPRYARAGLPKAVTRRCPAAAAGRPRTPHPPLCASAPRVWGLARRPSRAALSPRGKEACPERPPSRSEGVRSLPQPPPPRSAAAPPRDTY